MMCNAIVRAAIMCDAERLRRDHDAGRLHTDAGMKRAAGMKTPAGNLGAGSPSLRFQCRNAAKPQTRGGSDASLWNFRTMKAHTSG